MKISVIEGDLLEQNVDAIVNPWNRNIIPWWLHLPTGVSGAIKKRGGRELFKEVGRAGPIPLGEAVFKAVRIAFPLIGAGAGGGSEDQVLQLMQHPLMTTNFNGDVSIVKFGSSRTRRPSIML